MLHREIQTIEAFGAQYTEYRYEAELPDDEPMVAPLTCGQCDYYQPGNKLSKGNCTILRKARGSSSLACPQVSVTPPF